MQQKWQALAQRDRRIIVVGTVVVAVLLLYAYLWSPVATATSNEFKALQRADRLLVWMQHAQRRLQAYRQQGYQMPRASGGPSLAVVLQVFKSQHIDYHIESSKQLDKRQVGVVIKQVSFDRLAEALRRLADQYGIVVQSMRATRQSTDGLVDANMILSRV